jgi:tetratricopeptide (TPR) repeat protein
MHTLIIRHISSNPDKFELVRQKDGKRTRAVEIPAPSAFPVAGRPNSSLARELRWYLEAFLDYPFHPETDHALNVLESLRQWGETAFNALFNNLEGGAMLSQAIAGGYQHLHLQISADDPRILAWQWEALKDPRAEPFAHLCRIERKLNRGLDPVPLSEKLPKDRVNILLVTARPLKNDVQYRSISRLLVELVEKYRLPAHIRILRPPTFDALREELRRNPNFYHILHFDGHGGYGNFSREEANGFTFKGPEGCLVFETENGEEDMVFTEKLSALLREHAVPAVVLNACQSGMYDDEAKDPFASVAANLLKSGVRSVTAMAYSLYVTGAQVFLPAFYRRLFEDGNMEKAVRAGRQQMLADMKRVCVRGKFSLRDWLVPVLYQQEPLDFSFAATAAPESEKVSLPPEIAGEDNPYGFIGRDRPILELERALRSKSPAVLICGMGGIGKTTLAKGFVQWLAQTQGLGKGCFWFAFNEIHNAESVINRMGEALFGGNFSLAPLNDRVNDLAAKLREHRFLIVWDNFESVCGIEGTEVRPLMDGEQRSLLSAFLKALRNGKTRVIITSRGAEEWIRTERRKLDITGLDGEERALLLNEIIAALGLRIRRDDPHLKKLMDLLNGHPLDMRVILPLLEKESAASLITALRSDIACLKASLKPDADEIAAKLYATLGLARNALPVELRPLLTPLGLHERFVDMDYLENMARQVDKTWTGDKIRRFGETLSVMGLLHDRGQNVYELHPALTGYLRTYMVNAEAEASRTAWTRAFVDVMGSLANALTPKELHEKREQFHLFGASFHFAMSEAERIGMDLPFRAILQSLAEYARNMRNYKDAEDLFLRLAEAEKIAGNPADEAAAYHQLGRIAEERRDFDAAEKWYRKSLEINEKHGNEHGAALTYGQIGILAGFQEHFEASGKWLIKCILGFTKCNDPAGVQRNANNFKITYEQAGPETREKLKALWEAAGLGEVV